MGDRTWVRLEILSVQKEAADEIVDTWDTEEDDHGVVHTYCYDEVNYGTLDCLEELKNAGIAFDSCWGEGAEYGAGTSSYRFTPDGGVITKEVYDSELNPDMLELMRRIDDPVALRQYLLDHQEKTFVPPLEDSQVAYGKRYQLLRLVDAVPKT